ncbi:28S ribosomal protein S6, mitochondrial, partial [Frankliniella fusca]
PGLPRAALAALALCEIRTRDAQGIRGIIIIVHIAKLLRKFTVETIVLHSLAEFTSEFTTTVRATVVKYNLSVVSKECPGSVPEIAVSFKRDSSYK